MAFAFRRNIVAFIHNKWQREGALFKQRARSMISPFYIAKKRVNEMKENKCSYCAILGGMENGLQKGNY